MAIEEDARVRERLGEGHCVVGLPYKEVCRHHPFGPRIVMLVMGPDNKIVKGEEQEVTNAEGCEVLNTREEAVFEAGQRFALIGLGRELMPFLKTSTPTSNPNIRLVDGEEMCLPEYSWRAFLKE